MTARPGAVRLARMDMHRGWDDAPASGAAAPAGTGAVRTARQWLAEGRPAWVVEIVEVRGSAPRAAGTRMAVAADAACGTIGGGHLELEAIRLARAALVDGAGPFAGAFERRFALGPALGQCCGGAVRLRFEPLTAAALARWPATPSRFHLQLYGAGHVGRAIVRVLETLPCRVDWIDERDDEFAAFLAERAGQSPAPHVRIVCVDALAAEIAAAPAGGFCLILTHDHDLDFELCEAALRRGDLGFVGLIGSATKRARFERRLLARGVPPQAVARLVSPIGMEGIAGKEPEVIAVAVAAQLLQRASQAQRPVAAES